MRLIIEAKLLLTDEEARIRYDKEYVRYKSIQKQIALIKDEKHKKQEFNKTYNQEQNKEASTQNVHFNYQFEDEILKKWMENAREQAVKNVLEMITELRESSILGFGMFIKIALMAITISAMYFVIILILNSI